MLIALPNLASWHNRLMLLSGYQIRDIEVSSETVVGVPRRYRGQEPTGHIHTVTPGAFSELMTYHGFQMLKMFPGTPHATRINPLLALADSVLALKVSLARRFFYLGRKPG